MRASLRPASRAASALANLIPKACRPHEAGSKSVKRSGKGASIDWENSWKKRKGEGHDGTASRPRQLHHHPRVPGANGAGVRIFLGTNAVSHLVLCSAVRPGSQLPPG